MDTRIEDNSKFKSKNPIANIENTKTNIKYQQKKSGTCMMSKTQR
jgi:hypothetical protein